MIASPVIDRERLSVSVARSPPFSGLGDEQDPEAGELEARWRLPESLQRSLLSAVESELEKYGYSGMAVRSSPVGLEPAAKAGVPYFALEDLPEKDVTDDDD